MSVRACYLGGSIDLDDNNNDWRVRFADAFKGKPIVFFNPVMAFLNSMEADDDDVDSFVSDMNDTAVSKSDVCVFYLKKDVLTFGSFHELRPYMDPDTANSPALKDIIVIFDHGDNNAPLYFRKMRRNDKVHHVRTEEEAISLVLKMLDAPDENVANIEPIRLDETSHTNRE